MIAALQGVRRARGIAVALVCLGIATGAGALQPGSPAEAGSPGSSARGPDRIDRAWMQGGEDLGSRAAAVRLLALRTGARELEAQARALVSPQAASRDRGTALGRALSAVQLAPDLPLAYVALARAHWDEGERAAALRATWEALSAIPRHVEASLWLASSFLVLFAAVLVVGSLLFIGLVSAGVLSHASHDLGDLFPGSMPGYARAALLVTLLLVPLALGEGPLGLVLALLVLAFAYGDANGRMALALAGVLIVLGLHPLVKVAGAAVSAIDGDPVASAALSVSRGTASSAEIDRLEAHAETDAVAAQALALRARRAGRIEEAFARYTALQQREPTDPVVLTNLGNLYFERGDFDRAADLYERAVGVTDSPTLLFNLSQAYARLFRMDEFEQALRVAQGLGADEVAELSHIGDPSFVADLPLPSAELRARMVQGADGRGFDHWLTAPLAPGWLGLSWLHSAGGLAAAALLGLWLGGRYDQSSRCRRCGHRICSRCDDTIWNSEICDSCHTLFHRPEATDATLRMARLTALKLRESRLTRLALGCSLLLPGAGGMLARRPDLGFAGILLAAWAVAAVWSRGGPVPDPLAAGGAGILVLLLSAVLAATGYLVVVAWGLLVRRSL